MRITPLGDSALLVEIEASSAGEAAGLSQQLARVLSAAPLAGVQDIVPAFCTTAIHYAPGAVPGESAFAAVEEWVRAKVASLPPESAREAREVAIPVCYGGEMGPDLPEVAARSGLSPEGVIAQHSDARYAVRAVGFTPGFPYLAGLPEPLHTPRRATPRSQVPAGSVGIGGAQTGIYPLETPGGWNLIGRTPLALFDVTATPPARLQAGDAVRFEPITPEEFARIEAEQRRPSVHPAQPSAVPDETAPGIEVLRPGLWTSVQDGGRHGWQAQGVPVGGAMDAWALRVGNLLVGNAPEAAALECTLRGPVLRFTHDAVIAVTGATVDGVPAWQPFVVTAGETLSLEVIAGGCRVYLAIAGGVTTPPILGSRSTYVPAAFGGLQGRTLRTGDHLPLGEPRVRTLTGGWRLSPSVVPTWSSEVIVRVVPGTQADWFAEATRAALTASDYRVAPQSDRMGLRLQGPALALPAPREMRSEAVSAGAIQVPPDGQPIVLGADCQTIGGYPKIAHVASVDLPKLGQARPGDTVRFREITLDEARRLRRERERDLGVLRAGLYQRHGLS